MDTIMQMDNVSQAAHFESALAALHISNPDNYMNACMAHTSCYSCVMATPRTPCGWCPYSQVCVPDPSNGLLASIRDSSICPFPSERYEFRARALGCAVSSVTLWSTVVSFVIGIIITIALTAIIMYLARRKLLVFITKLLKTEDTEVNAGSEPSDHEQGYEAVDASDTRVEKSEVDSIYSTDVGYVYDPQMLPNRERPRVHESPKRNPNDIYTRFRAADDEDENKGPFWFF
ncbi:hypothetical protein V1512DRAFT_261815 [Lipomyces arxii]|uniref:uncharacterized protein n=1 Tax=Lipomyces arxii TaxID=56418 RepID=UPI0034CF8D4B